MSNLKDLEQFRPGSNPAEAWTKWRQSTETYWIAAELNRKPVAQEAVI